MERGSNIPPEFLVTGETSRKYMDFIHELTPEVPIGEDKIEKFMQELYKEMMAATGECMRWESESCGAAVSDSASTVMAGVEYGGKVTAAPGRCGCKCGSNGGLVVVDAGNGEGGEINGCRDCGAREVDGEDEEEWLKRVMSWGPADLVPGFWNDVHCGGSS